MRPTRKYLHTCLIARDQTSDTLNRFTKLVGSTTAVSSSAAIIDLTGDDTITQCPVVLSNKKFKKYIKYNKIIRKCRLALKKQSRVKNCVNLRRDRVKLVQQLKTCSLELEHCQVSHDLDIKQLHEQLIVKENLLSDIFRKYEESQHELSMRLLQAGKLVDLVKYSAERYESLTTNLSCTRAHPIPIPEPRPVTTLLDPPHTVPSIHNTKQHKSVLFTDKFGKGLGSFIQHSLPQEHIVTSYCYPNLHFNNIINKIVNTQFDANTTLVLLIGNSLDVIKSDIANGINTLLKLNLKNIMICALPYSDCFSDTQNSYVHTLNNFIYTLTCCHRDKLLFFDTNKFVSEFHLSRESMFFPNKYKDNIATLIAYNINIVIANNMTKCRISDEPVLTSYSNNTVIDCLN